MPPFSPQTHHSAFSCFIVSFILSALLFGRELKGQTPTYQITGPHTEYKGPYHIRIFVNYVQSPTNPWTQGVDLIARADILAEAVLRRNGIECSPDCSESNLRALPGKQKQEGSGKQYGLKIYPNPARDILQIAYAGGGAGGQVRLFDLQGRLRREIRLSPGSSPATLPVGDLPAGLYVAQWFCDGRSGSAKVIVSR